MCEGGRVVVGRARHPRWRVNITEKKMFLNFRYAVCISSPTNNFFAIILLFCFRYCSKISSDFYSPVSFLFLPIVQNLAKLLI